MGDFSICFSEHLTGHPNKLIEKLKVALFVSAWIETVEETSAVTGKRSVALFVSAWIETMLGRISAR